jgi:hypothetical protein
MKLSTLLSIVTASASLVAFNAMAGETDQKSYVTGYLGYTNVLDSDQNDFAFGAEYRFKDIDFGIRPVVGGFVTDEGAAYGYAGLNWDVALIENELYLIPNFAAGAYAEGDGADLGGAIEFRSGIELAYQFENQHRLGLAFNHMSNASIYDKNPGTEVAIINYSIPADKLF